MIQQLTHYVVTFDGRNMRVSEHQINEFLHVLLFNGVKEFKVVMEER